MLAQVLTPFEARIPEYSLVCTHNAYVSELVCFSPVNLSSGSLIYRVPVGKSQMGRGNEFSLIYNLDLVKGCEQCEVFYLGLCL